MKKRSLVVFMAVLMLVQMMLPLSVNAENEIIYLDDEQAQAETRADLVKLGLLDCVFPDTEGHWAEDTIDELAIAGIINGKEEDVFDPDGTVTNAEFVKLLTCSVEEYEENASFDEGVIGDVLTTDWHYSYVASALKAGIIYAEDCSFAPNSNIKRGETAIWISRALGIEALEDCQFTDIHDEEVKKAVAAAYSQGIITGYNAYTYGPDNTLTRAEAATLIKRVMKSYRDLHTTRESSNTLTYNENVIEVKNDGKNEIVSTDEQAGQLVFENCTDDVKNIEVGQILYIESCEEFPDGGVVKAEAVEKTGKGVKIETSAPTLEEVFSEIDMSDTVAISPDDFIPESADEGIVMMTPGADGGRAFLSNDEELVLRSLAERNNIDDISDMLVFEIEGNGGIKGEKEEHLSSGAVDYKSTGIGITATITPKIKYDIKFTKDGNGKKNLDLTFIIESEMVSGLSLDVGRKVEKSWKLGSFKLKLGSTPLLLEGDLNFTITAEGEVELSATATEVNQIGVILRGGNKTLVNKTELTDAKLSAEGEVKVEVGPAIDAALAVSYLFGNLDIIDVGAGLGAGIKGETEKFVNANASTGVSTHNTQKDENGNVHICDICINGTIYGFVNGEIGVSDDLKDILGIEEVKKDNDNKTSDEKEEGKNTTVNLFSKFGLKHDWEWKKWYYSVSTEKGNEFGWGKCPNLYSQLEFTETVNLSKSIYQGDEINLKARAALYSEMSHPIAYKWYRNGAEINNSNSYNLVISDADRTDGGTYNCLVYYTELGEELLSKMSEDMHVEVKEDDVVFTVNPSGHYKMDAAVSVDEFNRIKLKAHAISGSGAKCTYQWFKNGSPISGATGEVYSEIIKYVSQGGTYYCVATTVDSNGNVIGRRESKRAIVEVTGPVMWNGNFGGGNSVMVPFEYCKADGRVRIGYAHMALRKISESDNEVTYRNVAKFYY